MSDRCKGKVGSPPWWMGVDQYDPCRCVLTDGHDGECQCEHTAYQQVPDLMTAQVRFRVMAMTDRELIAEARSYLANNDGSSFYYGKDVITRLADALESTSVKLESARADGLRHAAELLESWDSEATVFVLLPGDTAYSGVPVEGVLADRLRALAGEPNV